MNVITRGDIFIVIKKELWRRIPSASAQSKCRECHLSWCILQLWRAVDGQPYRASLGVFQCRESCVTAKPSRALQRHFWMLGCQCQALLQLLFGVICAEWVRGIPGHFRDLSLLTHSTPSVPMLWQGLTSRAFSMHEEAQKYNTNSPARGKCHGLGSPAGLRQGGKSRL